MQYILTEEEYEKLGKSPSDYQDMHVLVEKIQRLERELSIVRTKSKGQELELYRLRAKESRVDPAHICITKTRYLDLEEKAHQLTSARDYVMSTRKVRTKQDRLGLYGPLTDTTTTEFHLDPGRLFDLLGVAVEGLWVLSLDLS